MPIPDSRRRVRLSISAVVASVAVLATACGDAANVVAPRDPVPAPAPTLASLRCDVSVAQSRMTCGTALARGLSLSAGPITLVGQGDYVFVRSTNISQVGTVFTFDATVQNRLAEALGTVDGTNADAEGVRVVLAAPPTVTGGTGTVTALNADGVATYTAPSQSYWQYAAPLAPNATSATKSWQFSVPATVTTFSFDLFVRAQIPDTSGFLRWRPMAGTGPLNAVTCTALNACVAVGDGGAILRWNGSAWSAHMSGTTSALLGVACASTSECIAVGAGGTVLRWTASAWSAASSPVGTALQGVACANASDCVAVGSGGVIVRWNGTAWSSATSPTSASLAAVSCVNTSDCVAVGAAGTIVRWNGTAWSTESSPTANALSAVHCNATNACVAAGASGTLVRWNGTSWATETSPTSAALRGVQCMTASTCVVVGAGGTVVRRSSGGTWSEDVNAETSSIVPAACYTAGWCEAMTGVACTNATDCVAVGAAGTVMRGSGTAWTPDASGLSDNLNDVSCSSASNCIAVGAAGRVLRWDGSGWRQAWRLREYDGAVFFPNLTGIDCTGSNTCVVTGDRTFQRWDGASWRNLPTFGNRDGTGETSRSINDAGSTRIRCTVAAFCVAAGSYLALWDGTKFGYGGAPLGDFASGNIGGPTFSVDCRASQECWAVGEVIGHTWTELPSVPDASVRQITYGWGTETNPTASILRGVSCPGALDFCVAVGDNGTILHRELLIPTDGSTDATFNLPYYGVWVPQTSPTANGLRDVICSSVTECMAVGDAGTVLRWNGTAWRVVPPFTTQRLNRIRTFDGTKRIIVGDGGLIQLADR